MQMIPMAIGQGLNNAQYRNRGQSTGLLGGPGAIDGTAQSWYNAVDPFNFSGKASSGHGLDNIIDPGNVWGLNQAANPYGPGGVGGGAGGMPGGTLPNLGSSTLVPQMPGGTFRGPALGHGRYNDMAALSAGQLFDPTTHAHPASPSLMPLVPGGKGSMAGGGHEPMPGSGHAGVGSSLNVPAGNSDFLKYLQDRGVGV